MFKKYNSIENAYRKDFIERVALATIKSNDFVVQEKVHGANFSLITNGADLKSAKRTSLLEGTDHFNNHALIKELYYDKILKLYKAVKTKYPNTESITVFGEIFGGSYPDIEQARGAIRVQKGIFYAPYNEFYAFNIMVNQAFYLNVTEANELLETYGFFYAKTLFRGTLKEVLAYPNAFESKISEWLKLPEIKNNTCEGIVIKPVVPHFLPNGSRVIIKNKNAKWSEKSKANSKPLVKVELSDEVQNLLSELERYINPNRLANVMSKESNLDSTQIGKLIGLLSKDALEDFLKEFKTPFDTLEKSEQKQITKQLNQFAAQLVRQELLQIN